MYQSSEQASIERRCLKANLLLNTAIIETIPTLDANAWHYFEVDLRGALHGEDEVVAYAPRAGEAISSGNFTLYGVKRLLLSLGAEPPMARINIEMGTAPVGYISGDSLQLFDD